MTRGGKSRFPARVDFRVLGPLEVRDGERVLALGGPKRRALAALLLLAENRPVPASRLVDGMWGEQPPAAAASSLQNQVSRLRSVLGDRLETTAAGYLLRVQPGELDLDRFRRLLEEARASEPAAAAERLREALALWRGPALADLEGEPADAAAAHLDGLRLTALEERIDADLALGRHADLVPELEVLTAEHPFRERLWGQLVLALYRAGRQAAALDAYVRARRALVDELGTEPGPALRELHALILRQDPTLDLPQARPAAEQPAPAPDRETRRTVTVVIATFAVGNGDPEARRETLRRVSGEAARTIERHGGTPASMASGERCLGVFGAPRAHEDDALRAVGAAFELWSEGAVTAAGIATGEVVTGSPDAGDALVSGAPLERAEHLLESAAGGGVLVSERTWRLVRHAVAGDPAGGGYRIERIDPTAPILIRRLDTPLVGRDAELADVVRTFERAARDAHPQLLTVFGEPGIGKTRLATEAARHLASQATVVVGRCEVHGSDATYAPLREIVTAVGGGTAEGLHAVMADEPEGELVATRIAAALGAAGTAGPVQETAWAVRRLLEKLARARPVVLLLEDVHWAAPALLDLVEHVVDVGRAPILVLCLARPDLLDARPRWAGGKVNSSSLVLRALSADEAARLLDGLVEGTGLERGERERIVAVAEGNPLFLEQLLAAALDESPGGVPDSIQALVAARLDRLPWEEREVLDAAAVCGATFSVGAVADLVGRDVRHSVDELVRRDLLRPADVPLFGEETLAFAHALIHDASYRSVTKRRRAALHEASAARLARVSIERELDLDELVGHHLESAAMLRTEAGETGAEVRSLSKQAAHRLGAAGLRAYERHDAAAASSLLRRAVRLSGDEEPGRSEAQFALANSLLWMDEDDGGGAGAVRRTAVRRTESGRSHPRPAFGRRAPDPALGEVRRAGRSGARGAGPGDRGARGGARRPRAGGGVPAAVPRARPGNGVDDADVAALPRASSRPTRRICPPRVVDSGVDLHRFALRLPAGLRGARRGDPDTRHHAESRGARLCDRRNRPPACDAG